MGEQLRPACGAADAPSVGEPLPHARGAARQALRHLRSLHAGARRRGAARGSLRPHRHVSPV